MKGTMHYNPVKYLKTDEDIQRFADFLLEITTPEYQVPEEPIYIAGEHFLLCAALGYLCYYAEPGSKNIEGLMGMIRAARIEMDDDWESTLDVAYKAVKKTDNNFATKSHDSLRVCQEEVGNRIVGLLLYRLRAFDLDEISELTKDDNLELDTHVAKTFTLTEAESPAQELLSKILLYQAGRLGVHVNREEEKVT